MLFGKTIIVIFPEENRKSKMEKSSVQLQTTVLNVSINIAQQMSMQIIIIIIMLSKIEILYYFKIQIILNKSVT